jgi:hypothetical protein
VCRRELKPSRIVNIQRVLAPLPDGCSVVGFSLLYNHKIISMDAQLK